MGKSIYLATLTGYKEVDLESCEVISHVGTKEEIAEHEKTAKAKNTNGGVK